MKLKLLLGACLLSIVGSQLPALAAGKVAGFQYETFADGEASLEDNAIHYIPCLPTNNDCIELQESIEAELKRSQSEMELARSTVENPVEAWTLFTQLDQKILPRLSKKSGHTSIKTGKEGLYTFSCPTANCLIYSYGVKRDRASYWITITPGRKRLDLGPEKSIEANKPRNL